LLSGDPFGGDGVEIAGRIQSLGQRGRPKL